MNISLLILAAYLTIGILFAMSQMKQISKEYDVPFSSMVTGFNAVVIMWMPIVIKSIFKAFKIIFLDKKGN